jgi:hypothetical protein
VSGDLNSVENVVDERDAVETGHRTSCRGGLSDGIGGVLQYPVMFFVRVRKFRGYLRINSYIRPGPPETFCRKV